ncbi:hypothetical protein ASD11_16820 [Aeromicrobium sp. Root495]|nr:hypothetical protein ASD11_16820 [Aeromicrobium sp. Root495]
MQDQTDGGRVDDDQVDESVQAEEKKPGRVGPTALVGLAVAVVFGVTGGVAWWSATSSDDLSLAQERDAVLVSAKTEIAVLNTLDYRSVAKGLKAWQSASTGTLRDQFAGISTKDQGVLADQKKISKGKVVDAAVLEVDGDSATVLAAVEVTVTDGTDPSAEPVVKRNRFSADLARSGGTWKVANLQQVAVNVS